MNVMKTSLRLGLPLLAVFVLSAPASAQVSEDGRWMPFVGCWEAVGAEDDIGLLCFRPAEGGVELTNYVDGEIASTERLVADGARRPVISEGCEGWESVQFSEDGRRAFTSTEFECGTDEVRTGTGVMTFLSTTRWADVRALEMDGEPFAWVQEYELASLATLGEHDIEDPAAGLGMAVRTARMGSAGGIDLDDVTEASAVMGDKAVETWVVLQGGGMQADGQDLVELSDAGVSDGVIDAIVAVSNPREFMVEVGEDVEREYQAPRRVTHYRGYMAFNPFFYGWDPVWGLGYSAYYSPWSYRYGAGRYGYYDAYRYGYWGARPGYVIVRPRNDGGRVVPGRGYTRGTGTSAGAARPRGGAQPQYSGSGATSRSGGEAPRRARRRSGGSSYQPSATTRSPSAAPVRRAAPRSSGVRPSRSAPVRRSTGRAATPRPAASRAPARSGSSRPAARPSSGSRSSGPARSSGARRRTGGV